MLGSKRLGMVVIASACVLGGSVRAQQTVGLFQHDETASQPGYVLFSGVNDENAYLVDTAGYVVHSWTTPYAPGLSSYLLPNGHLLRGAQLAPASSFINARGHGGRIEEYDWDGNLVWSYELSTSSRLQHHDFVRLPNGNTVLMAWEIKSRPQAISAGRDPATIPNDAVWNDLLIEVDPAGQIVWEWSAWNHMIQDFDPSKSNYGVIADHPGRIDINAVPIEDFVHFNGIDYDPIHNYIVVSTREYSEFWLIDHSTTTAEAAGATGGNRGRGGQIVYRWGNPQIYGRGGAEDQILQHQHDAHWILTGNLEDRHVLVFNNSDSRGYSSAEEIALPVDTAGDFPDPGSGPHGPSAPLWTFVASPPANLFSPIISGADRQPNGNTFLTEGVTGRFLEVTSDGRTVWEYVNPVGNAGPLAQGVAPKVNGITFENGVFKARKYSPDYPAFAGRDLSPQAVLETGFSAPQAVGDGSAGTTPLTAVRASPAGDEIEVSFDATSCTASVDYNLVYGMLESVGTYELDGAECGIGLSGTDLWQGVPAGNLYFLVVGVDATGIYESGWGEDSAGEERNGTTASFRCGANVKVTTLSCP